MEVNLTVKFDDGKGRTFEKPKITIVTLVKKDYMESLKPGDYAFTNTIGGWELDCIVLCCPFCGYEAPLPYLISVSSKEPLTIKEVMHCSQCLKTFHVIDGKAIVSWGEMP